VDGVTVSQVASYEAWGTPSATGNWDNHLLWKGLMWEGDVDSLYYARNRWYDPELGRFANEDPIGHAGGDNLYVFGGNDPVNISDPTGTVRGTTPCLMMGWCKEGGLEFDFGQQSAPPPLSCTDNAVVDMNIAVAAAHKGDGRWFYNMVRNKGPWDYKQYASSPEEKIQLAHFGNFNYGATGRAVGYSAGILFRAAGAAGQRAQGEDWFVALARAFGSAPYGDDPVDQRDINSGIDYFNDRQSGGKCVH
jgi:RHS repeat-associated protein